MRKMFFAAVLAAGLAFSSIAHAFTPGQSVNTGAFCFSVDEPFMKKFTEEIMAEGREAYMRTMTDPANECYDIRLHRDLMGGQPLTLKLDKLLWEFTPPDNKDQVIEMWRGHDAKGVVGYTWLRKTIDPEA